VQRIYVERSAFDKFVKAFLPKVEALKKIFAENYIEKPTLVSSAKVTN